MLLTWALVAPALAASWDPDLRWRTLHTEHFNITFHDGEEQIAEEMAAAAEDAYRTLTVELGTSRPRPVDIVLVDWTDVANGMAQTVPSDVITIYVTNPTGDSTLGLYEDWNEAIITHELTHILHIDTVEGLPRVARWLMGSLISTHQVAPLWTIEGLATFEETRYTAGGRGRSPMVDMVKRAAVLDDAFPPLGNLDGLQALPPSGNLRYLFGQDFIQYIADTRGTDKWTEWVHRYGASVPFILPAKRTFGADFVTLYKEWKAELTRRYTAQASTIRAEGETPLRLVGDPGRSCGPPSFNPVTGDLWYSCADPARGNALWRLPAGESRPRIADKGKFADDIQWRNDGEAFLYTTSHVQDLYSVVDDVSLYTPATDASRSLTTGKRARDATFSPDGTRVVCVTNELQQNQLAELTIDQRLLPLTANRDNTQLSTPRFSPDGSRIAVSVWTAGQRDLWLYTVDGKPWRRLTWDTALDFQPAWSPDGSLLYFASDRSGVPNVYAVDFTDGHLYRVTNVVIGAFAPSPSPDGHTLAVSTYTGSGTRVATVALDRDTWKDLGELPRLEADEPTLAERPPLEPRVREGKEPEHVAGREARDERRAKAAAKAEAKLAREAKAHAHRDARRPVRDRPRPIDRAEPDKPTSDSASAPAPVGAAPAQEVAPPAPATPAPAAPDPRIGPYNPLPSLLPPRYWVPGTLLTTTGENYGLYLSAYTGGVDVLRHYGYSGYATWRTDANFLGGGASFTLNKFRPVFGASVNTYVSPYGTISTYSTPPKDGGAWIPGIERTEQRYWDHRVRGALTGYYPLDEHSSLSGGWRGELRESKDALPADVYYAGLPTRGFFSTLQLGWSRGDGEAYPLSISPEKARVLGFGVEYTASWLGSQAYDEQNQLQPFDQLQLSGEWREYVQAPWAANHVFAWKLSGGLSLGSTFRYGSFRLGGSFSENGITVIPEEWRSLRGFYPGTRDGETFWLASGEYRFPVWQVDRGVGTLPFFMRNVSGAVVVDAGNAWDDPADAAIGNSLLGVGAELRFSAIAFYGMGLYGRLGYAFSVLGDGIPFGSIDALYAQAGTSF